MLKKIISTVLGSRHERERKRVQPIVDAINEHFERLDTVSEDELRSQTAKLRAILAERTAELEARIAELRKAKHDTADAAERERIDLELTGADGRGGAEGELRTEIAEVLDELLPEAFATVKAAARRLLGTRVSVTGHELTWDMVPYDVQLMGGIQLHLGRIAEVHRPETGDAQGREEGEGAARIPAEREVRRIPRHRAEAAPRRRAGKAPGRIARAAPQPLRMGTGRLTSPRSP